MGAVAGQERRETLVRKGRDDEDRRKGKARRIWAGEGKGEREKAI